MLALALAGAGAPAADAPNPAKAEAELKAVRTQIDKVRAEMERDAGRRDLLAREIEESEQTVAGARSAMLLLFQALLFGLAFGGALLRKAYTSSGGARWAFGLAALAAVVFIPTATAFIGARLVHRFSKSCRSRPLQARDLRVVRRGQDLA